MSSALHVVSLHQALILASEYQNGADDVHNLKYFRSVVFNLGYGMRKHLTAQEKELCDKCNLFILYVDYRLCTT
jgi:hypothetical protein